MAGAERFDPYRILGVGREATPRQVARAYRRQAKRFHPDLHGPDAARQMRDLNRSWHILSDPGRRRAWDAGHPVIAAASHWAGAPRPMARAAPTASGTWSPWEAPSPAPADSGRVRVTETWPRPRQDAPAEPSGLRDSPWLAAAVAGALVIAIIVLGWVASSNRASSTPGQALDALGVIPAARVALDPTHEVAVYHAGDGQLGVATARLGPRGWEGDVLEERSVDQDAAVLLASGEPGSRWQSVVYGRAPTGVAQVRLSVASAGGQVVDGVWAIGVQAPLRPEQLNWRFEAADGTVLRSGNGELD